MVKEAKDLCLLLSLQLTSYVTSGQSFLNREMKLRRYLPEQGGCVWGLVNIPQGRYGYYREYRIFTKHWLLHKNHIRPEKVLFDHLAHSWHFIDGDGKKRVLEWTQVQREAEPRLGLWVEPKVLSNTLVFPTWKHLIRNFQVSWFLREKNREFSKFLC